MKIFTATYNVPLFPRQFCVILKYVFDGQVFVVALIPRAEMYVKCFLRYIFLSHFLMQEPELHRIILTISLPTIELHKPPYITLTFPTLLFLTFIRSAVNPVSPRANKLRPISVDSRVSVAMATAVRIARTFCPVTFVRSTVYRARIKLSLNVDAIY